MKRPRFWYISGAALGIIALWMYTANSPQRETIADYESRLRVSDPQIQSCQLQQWPEVTTDGVDCAHWARTILREMEKIK